MSILDRGARIRAHYRITKGKMMRHVKVFGAALLATAMFVALPGCEKPEGPAERAGKTVDKAIDQAGEKMEEAGKDIQDAAKNATK